MTRRSERKSFGIPFAEVDFAENRSSRALLFTDRQSAQPHERPKGKVGAGKSSEKFITNESRLEIELAHRQPISRGRKSYETESDGRKLMANGEPKE